MPRRKSLTEALHRRQPCRHSDNLSEKCRKKKKGHQKMSAKPLMVWRAARDDQRRFAALFVGPLRLPRIELLVYSRDFEFPFAQTKTEPMGLRFVSNLARPERFELPTAWFVARYSIQLSYGRVVLLRQPLRYSQRNAGGERGIRTLEGLLTLTPLAGERFRPLSHLSVLQTSFPAAPRLTLGPFGQRSGSPQKSLSY